MKSHTSLVAQQTRLSEWADLIRDCQNRPQGMKIDEWVNAKQRVRKNYTVFEYNKYRIRFIAPYSLEYYAEVKEWDKGYLVDIKVVAVQL